MASRVTPLNGGEWEAEGPFGYAAAQLGSFLSAPGISRLEVNLTATIDGITYEVPAEVSAEGADAVIEWLEEQADPGGVSAFDLDEGDEPFDIWDTVAEFHCDGYLRYRE